MLETLLQQEIKDKGPLSQNRFMELALQHPLYGYYRSRQAIGQDFTTAPEISQVFGELIGAWAIDYYIKLGQPKSLSLVELGPGKGTLMADFLRIAKLSFSFSEAINLYLVEINQSLKGNQQNILPSSAKWAERFEDIPSSSDPLLIIANEFFDAFPTHCYRRKENVLYERCVDDKFAFSYVKRHESCGPDQIWEESPQMEAYMNEICSRLLKQTGVFLCIDYGYEKGKGDSLQALFKGKPSNPLFQIGKSDLTCHVNFGKLRDMALLRGLGVLGPLSQREFLKNIGFDKRIEMLKQANPNQKAIIETAATRLIHPQQMGLLFKVIAMFSPSTLIPAGFK